MHRSSTHNFTRPQLPPLSRSSVKVGFQGQLQYDEVKGEGNIYTAEFWAYEPRLGRRWNQDPKPNPSISNYACFANNPILYTDFLGDTISLRGMSQEQINNFNAKIQVLNKSDLFKTYYEVLQNSSVTYTIKINDELTKGGQFNDADNTITIKSGTSEAILSQEIFHAFQKDLNVYGPEDHTVRETEGDLMTQYVAVEADLPLGGMLSEQSDTWAEEILKINGDAWTNPTNEQVQSEDYSTKFSKSVDNRIEYFKEKGEVYKGYTTPNSGDKPKAIQELFKKVEENKQ